MKELVTSFSIFVGIMGIAGTIGNNSSAVVAFGFIGLFYILHTWYKDWKSNQEEKP